MKTKSWQRTIGAISFLPLLCVTILYYGTSLNLLWSFLIYMSIAITITAGYHRYFSHATYECNRFWQFLFGFIGTASLNSSPIEWASVHIAHHKYSDTLADPYDSTWRQFFNFKERINIQAPKFVLKLMRNKVQKLWLKHSGTVAFCVALVMFLISPILFLYGYAIPVSAYLFTSYSHNIISHIGKQPRNIWLLEILIPMCGEWLHRSHHDQPRTSHFGLLDLGGHFIWVIRNDKR
jgi:stearoyl-CoA desaturase (delta-9 desaturase)